MQVYISNKFKLTKIDQSLYFLNHIALNQITQNGVCHLMKSRIPKLKSLNLCIKYAKQALNKISIKAVNFIIKFEAKLI